VVNGAAWPEDKPCALIRVGPNTGCNTYYDAQDGQVGLIGAVATADGYVRFLDIERSRFFSDSRDAFPNSSDPNFNNCPAPVAQASVDQTNQPLALYVAGNTSATLPTISLADLDTHHVLGWTTAGVSRTSKWFAYYHGIIPGLERRGGTLSRPTQALGTTLRFDMPGQDLTPWVNTTMLAVGDVVAFGSFTQADGSAVCPELQAENGVPFSREYVITAINGASIDLAPSTDGLSGEDGGVPGFDPPLNCLAKTVGASLQFRTAGAKPWLVLQGLEYRGRTGTSFTSSPIPPAVFYEPRFDYPLDYAFNPQDLAALPTYDQNIGLSFTIKIDGDSLQIPPGSYFVLQVASGQLSTQVSDTGSIAGFAGPMATYSSKKIPGGLLFVALTGANSLLQVDTSLLQIVGGVIAYR
jgi:hypothetical protein